MTIKELAQTTGLPISTIRYYEKKGLLMTPKRQANNYRDYDKASINRLYLIKYLSGLGMTLEDIRDFLGQLAKKQLDKEQLMSLLKERQGLIERQLEALLTLQNRLKQLAQHDQLLEDFMSFDWQGDPGTSSIPVDQWLKTAANGTIHQDLKRVIQEET